MNISKGAMLTCAALLSGFFTTNARDENLRGANSPLSKTAIIDDAAIKGHPGGVIVVTSFGRNEFDHGRDYELEPMENPIPSTGDGSLDAIFDEDATIATQPMALPVWLSTGISQCGEWDTVTHAKCCYRDSDAPNGKDGYCQPWGNGGGDLCREEPGLPACREVDNFYYLPKTCDEKCVNHLCTKEPKCAGYTWKKNPGRGKLKSTISSVYGGNTGYKCFVKGSWERPHPMASYKACLI